MRARLDLARQRQAGDPVVRITQALVHRGDVVLDVGARWGTYTSFFRRLVGPTGVVHAFEPNPQQARALHAIARGRPPVHVHLVALSDQSGQADLHVPLVGGQPADGLASLHPPASLHHAVTIQRQRLDDLRLNRINFLKCDVEGHELAVLRGGEETLRLLRPTLLVEIEHRHRGADVPATLAFLARLGYMGYAIYGEGLRPVEEFSLERDQIEPLQRSSKSHWMMPADYVHDFVFVAPDSDSHQLAVTRLQQLREKRTR